METKLLPSINNECLSCEQKSNKKWLVITVFCIANIANSITWLTYSPVASKAAQRYNVNLNVINWLSMIFMILYIPGAIFATWALERHGLRYALLTATIIQVVGTVMRIGAVDGIWIVFAFIGQFFCALAQPFFLNAPPKLSVLWFPDEQRSIATSIGAVANPLGVGIGFLIPSAVLGPDENMDRFFLLHIVEAAISVVAFLLVFIAIKSDPSQGKERDNYKANFTFKTYISQSKIVIRDWHFICLLISISIGVGVSSAIGTLSNQILKPFQYTDQVIGIYGALFIFLGIAGSALFALYCDKTKRYSGVLILCFLGAGASLVWWRFELVPAREIPLGITMALAGFFLTPTIPLEMDYGAICLPEIGESIISGILMSGGQVVSLALVLFAGPLIDRDNSNIHYLAYGSAGACFFAGLILILSESIRFAYKKRQSHERIDGN